MPTARTRGSVSRDLIALLLLAARCAGSSSSGSQPGETPPALDASPADAPGNPADAGGGPPGDGPTPVDAGAVLEGGSPIDGAGPPFPNGGRQYKTIVNLVDPALVQAIEAALSDASGMRTSASATQAFYALYPDEYDFLYFFLDHEVPNATAEAAFDVVYRPAIPGTGIDKPMARTGFGSRGRLRGVAAFQATTNGAFPALAHETAHYWANYLDPALGFGHDRDADYGPHWGVTGVYGQLGGFDPKSVRCIIPMGAAPPACNKDPGFDDYSYEMSAFAPNTNTFLGIPYAPLELYLMGLLPQSELPSSFSLVQDARFDALVPPIALVAGTGISAITVSSIVARHGVRAPAADSDKRFSAAFVVVSAAPRADGDLDQVVTWQQFWGGDRPANAGEMSFEQATGGRAKMTTQIGRRRIGTDPAPLPPM
jgi:hypothetical protein